MNRALIIFFVLLLTVPLAVAQRRGEKVEALRVAYITKHVSLSEEEGERFWPVYNEYHDKLRSVRRSIVRIHRSFSETMNEEDVKALAAQEMELRRTEKDIHSVYSNRITEIIGYRKYMRLRVAEERFRKEMLKIAREKR